MMISMQHVQMGIYSMHTYIHTYMHTYIHTYINTYIHTYIHTSSYIHRGYHTPPIPWGGGGNTGHGTIYIYAIISYNIIYIYCINRCESCVVPHGLSGSPPSHGSAPSSPPLFVRNKATSKEQRMDLRAQQMISLWRYHEVSMVKKQVNGETQKRVSPCLS